jgi:hypothetical protein
MNAKTKALEKKKLYTRHVKSGGMNIRQLITPNHVFSYSHNKNWSNGDVGRKISIQKRKDTNL